MVSKANLAVIGTYWHRIDAMVAFRESENPVYVSCILKYSSDLHISLIPVLLLNNFGHRKTMLSDWNNSTNSNPFAGGFFDFTRNQQGVLRVTRRLFGYCRKVAAARYVLSNSKRFGLLPKTLPPGCLSEVGQPVQSIPCTLCRTILSYCTVWYVRYRATPQPTYGCLLSVPAHG